MGASAPQAPSFQLPSGSPSFIQSQSGVTAQTLANAQNPGAGQIWGAAGNPDINSAQGQSVAADIQGYGMSDADFAARYPGMVNARNQYQNFAQNLLGTQTPASMAQGNSLMNAGSQYLAPGASLARQSATAGQSDMSMGQNLINGNQAIDPLVQQELMRSGLSSAAGSLGGAAALGGTAGQAAVGRDLGVGAQNWINQQRQMGMSLQQTGAGLDSSLAGAAATLGNAGSGMMQGGQSIENSATSNANQTMAVGSSIFQPRTFGLSGSDAANIALSNTAGENNMNQFIYGTKVGVAAQNAGIGASNANASAQANAQNTQAAVGTGTAVATTAATVAAMSAMGCWCARAAFGELDSRFHRFRFWLVNLSPKPVKKLYMRYGRQFSAVMYRHGSVRYVVRALMEVILQGAPRYA